MTLSRKDYESIICIACGKAFGDHTKKGLSRKFSIRSLMECFFRVQGSYVSDGIDNKPIIADKPVKVEFTDTAIDETLDEMTNVLIDDVEWKEE